MKEQQSAKKGALPKSTLAVLNVLLADDDADDRFLFDKALKEITIATQLTSVQDGEQLMSYLSDNNDNLPDIIFLDLSMPRKTGFECLTEIKEDKKLQNISVVVFTTSFGRGIEYEQGLINTLSAIGSLEYIRKPNDFGQLKQIIQKTLATLIEKNLPKDQKKIA